MKTEAVIQQFRNLSESEERTRYLELVVTLMEHAHIVDARFVENAIFEKVEAVMDDPEAHEFEEDQCYSLECLRGDLVHLEAGWLGVLDSDAV